MKIIYNILAILSVLLTGCSDEIVTPDTGESEGTITVYFKTGSEITTRSTNLISSDNRQHAKYVHLYIFDNATNLCVQSKDVNWKQSVGATATQYYTLSGLTKGTTYTLLAVGLDEDPATSAATTYGLPGAITIGTSLTGLMATLTNDKIKDNIATSELFSGWEEVTAGTTTSVTINLYRRVAGVLAYIKDIPADVANIQVKLYKNQYKDVPLKKADKSQKYDTSDHGNTPLADSQVLMSIPVNDTELNKTELADGHGYTVTKQAGTVLQGAYVLPIEAPAAGNYTLTLETLNAGGAVIKTYNVKMLTTTENGGTTTETVMTNYPLYANQFYSIGKRNVKDGIDEPISLGEDIYIRVDPIWEGISDDIPLE